MTTIIKATSIMTLWRPSLKWLNWMDQCESTISYETHYAMVSHKQSSMSSYNRTLPHITFTYTTDTYTSNNRQQNATLCTHHENNTTAQQHNTLARLVVGMYSVTIAGSSQFVAPATYTAHMAAGPRMGGAILAIGTTIAMLEIGMWAPLVILLQIS